MRSLLLGLLLASCTSGRSDESGGTTLEHTDCQAMCSDMKEVMLQVATNGGFSLTAEQWQATCDGAPADTDCESCYGYLGAAVEQYSAGGVTMDCGCGLDLAGLQECSQDPMLTETEAEPRIANCEEACAGFPAR